MSASATPRILRMSEILAEIRKFLKGFFDCSASRGSYRTDIGYVSKGRAKYIQQVSSSIQSSFAMFAPKYDFSCVVVGTELRLEVGVRDLATDTSGVFQHLDELIEEAKEGEDAVANE